MKKKTGILIADDHALLRMGLASLLDGEPDLAVIGEAEDGDEAVRLANKLNPDLVIMDLMMPVMDGAEACRRIREALPGTKILILTSFPESVTLIRALASGADGIVVKDTPNDRLLDSLRQVIAGRLVVPEGLQRRLDESAALFGLSERQLDFLGLAARGYGNEDIVRMRETTIDAVKKQFSAIFKKLGVTNRAEAVALAAKAHLFSSPYAIFSPVAGSTSSSRKRSRPLNS